MVNKSQIMKHAQVVDINGDHVGIVDHFEGDEDIKLTKSDPNADGHHHIIAFGWVSKVSENKVILGLTKGEVQRRWESR
ncbi:TPA: DUF2171 domain-containing protein [Serratia fonticola]|nr:DUF2171 domain-containing protein [Serratia fonticola]